MSARNGLATSARVAVCWNCDPLLISCKHRRPSIGVARSATIAQRERTRSRVAASRSGAREDVERDRSELAAGGAEREDVEQLVVPEHMRHRVGTSPRIDNRARGVQKSPRNHQQDADNLDLQQLRERNSTNPSQQETDRSREPLRSTN